MSGLLGWVDGLAKFDAIEAMVSMAQAARIENALNIGNESSPAAIAAWQTHDPVILHSQGSISAAVLGQARWDVSKLQRHAEQDGLAASIIDGYRTLGPRLLERIHGPFALAIVDAEAQTTLLAIDRLGIQTLAFACSPNGIVFASDARAVAAHPNISDALDQQGLFNYLFFHMVPSPGSIFAAVEKLLPGEYALWRRGRLSRQFYWRMAYQDSGTDDELGQRMSRFKLLLADAVRIGAADSSNVGTFLSGGTDSSTVAGFLTRCRGGPIDTFSIGFDAEGYDEMEYARLASHHFGTHPHEYYVTPSDVVTAIPRIAAAFDEPFGNASAIPAYYCAKLARDAGIDVMLAGDGGDEIFGGNARYAKQKVFELYWQLPVWLRQGLIEPLSCALPEVGIMRKAKSYVAQARVPLPERLETYNFLRREPLEHVLTADFLAQIQADHPEAMLREVYNRTESHATINRLLHLDLKFTLADNDLRKVSRACELAGVGVRYPLLDEALVAFSGELAADQKVRGQHLRYFFKQALNDFLPPKIINKTKHGFGLPFGIWMRMHPGLMAVANDSLSALCKRNIVQPSYLERLMSQQRSEHSSYYGVMIWVLMMLEQWLQHHDRT